MQLNDGMPLENLMVNDDSWDDNLGAGDDDFYEDEYENEEDFEDEYEEED